METYKKNWFKYIIGFVVCILFRLIPFRPPNIEPILATQMPFAKAYGATAGFIFAFANIALYDLVTAKVGWWTLLTAATYGIIGIGSAWYFSRYANKRLNYVVFAIVGTLFFDAVTGLLIGPLFFHQMFIEALIGQIPFTFLHLAGNIGFALILSPFVYRFVVENKKFETESLSNFFVPKHI